MGASASHEPQDSNAEKMDQDPRSPPHGYNRTPVCASKVGRTNCGLVISSTSGCNMFPIQSIYRY